MLDLVFIITRHVTNSTTDRYWQDSYNSIRKIYPDTKILIIDDNSPYISTDIKLDNCDIIKSDFPQRGEVLPYYYFYKLQIAKKAIIIHDSVFINEPVDVCIENYRFLWQFEHDWDIDVETICILNKLKHNIVDFYNQKHKWKGCFGAMSIITLDFLTKIENKFNFFEIVLGNITNRNYRMCFERIFACICVFMDKEYQALYGDIHKWCYDVSGGKKIFDIKYGEHLNYQSSIMKVWTAR